MFSPPIIEINTFALAFINALPYYHNDVNISITFPKKYMGFLKNILKIS